ncbi:hypothetical protein FACS1894188_02570 [Clostridia bacterium]|nr:hypothetical protein FACS1894188_02570 [Clostridia bacterium]
MAIQPMEIQLMVQRTADISHASQNAAGKQGEIAQQFTELLQKQVQEQKEQVRQSDEKDAVDKDGKGGNKQEKRKGSRAKATEQKNATQRGKISMFDVSI